MRFQAKAGFLMRMKEMVFDQKAYLREMNAYNDDIYFARYAKNIFGKPPVTPGDNLIQKAKEIKNHAK